MTGEMSGPPAESVTSQEIGEGAQRTAPLGLLVRLVDSAKNAIFPAIALFVGFDELREAVGFLPLLGAVAAIIGFFTWLGWWKTTYRVGEEDVRVESGVVSRQARSVPYERIQDVSLEQPLVARLFGLVRVKFETGAGGGEDLNLAYVSENEAERLREVVRERREDTGPVAAVEDGETNSATETAPIFAMDEGRLVRFGMFEFSLVIFAVLLGAMGQIEFLISWDDLIGSVWNEAEGRGKQIAALGLAAQLVGALFAVGSLVVLGLVTGITQTFVREYSFRLDKTPKGFRRRRGLFTKTDVVMPVHRVQAMQYGTKWFRRLFGWHSLKFVSLAQDAKSASHVVVPFGQPEEIAPVADLAGLSLPPAEMSWSRPSPKRWIDDTILSAIVPFIALLGVIVFSPVLWWPIALIAAIVALIGAANWFSWLRHRFALAVGQVFTRRGILAPQIMTAQKVKLQSVEISQGPIARLRGYATVHLGLAGGTMSIPGVPLAKARALRADVLDAIAKVDFSELPK